MKRIPLIVMALAVIITFAGCKKDENKAEPKLIFKFKFDPTQERLGNLGQPQALPAGHEGQSPTMNKMSAHYLELAPGAFTPLGNGQVLYRADEVSTGGSLAIDFSKATFAGNNEEFFSMPLKDVAAGDYEYLRVSLAYQNYDVQMYIDTVISGFTIQQSFPCTVASFVGFNTYINNYNIKNQNIVVNDDKLQGYWGFESSGNIAGFPFNYYTTGQAPPGATTVVNPIASTSPIPAGSCVVTAAFDGGKLSITGNEDKDVVVVVSLSTNKSFEWIENVVDGKWEPAKGENIVDMGVRGMRPYVE
jgi:hypothetical protein